jgi:hypothetical protein
LRSWGNEWATENHFRIFRIWYTTMAVCKDTKYFLTPLTSARKRKSGRDVFRTPKDVSEEAIVRSKRNLENQPNEKIDRCKRADFVAYDNCERQLVSADCSTMYETDQRKLTADKWKISRAMKDTSDSTIKKYGEKVRPYRRFSVFDKQVFRNLFISSGRWRANQPSSCLQATYTSRQTACRSTSFDKRSVRFIMGRSYIG